MLDSELGRGSHLFRVMQDHLGGWNEVCTILPGGNLAQGPNFLSYAHLIFTTYCLNLAKGKGEFITLHSLTTQ